jgi:ubiquinone biosynthesis monooxygenase Coq7
MSRRNPGEARSARMARVDQAGEYGATRIYAGQLAVLGTRGPHAAEIAGMNRQEAEHLARFDALVARRRVRPTMLQPLWSLAGFALGAATALAGPRTAMACTAAIEQEIDRHYTRQLDDLGDEDPELAGLIAEFRDEERAHRDAAIAAGAQDAPGYPLLSRAIGLGCRLAIRLSERL